MVLKTERKQLRDSFMALTARHFDVKLFSQHVHPELSTKIRSLT